MKHLNVLFPFFVFVESRLLNVRIHIDDPLCVLHAVKFVELGPKFFRGFIVFIDDGAHLGY